MNIRSTEQTAPNVLTRILPDALKQHLYVPTGLKPSEACDAMITKWRDPIESHQNGK